MFPQIHARQTDIPYFFPYNSIIVIISSIDFEFLTKNGFMQSHICGDLKGP